MQNEIEKEIFRALNNDKPIDVELLSILGSWGDTLPDEDILDLLKDYNAGLPIFNQTFANQRSNL